jgi:hypothetical protein
VVTPEDRLEGDGIPRPHVLGEQLLVAPRIEVDAMRLDAASLQ